MGAGLEQEQRERASSCASGGLDVGESILSAVVPRDGNRLPREGVESAQKCVDVSFGDVVYRWPWQCWLDPVTSEGFSSLNDSVILWDSCEVIPPQ